MQCIANTKASLSGIEHGRFFISWFGLYDARTRSTLAHAHTNSTVQYVYLVHIDRYLRPAKIAVAAHCLRDNWQDYL